MKYQKHQTIIKDSTLGILIFALIIYSAHIFLQTTTWGAGLSPDSLNYIQSAKKIIDGKSLANLPTHWPPLYPIILAASKMLSGDILFNAKWLQLIIYCTNICVFTFILYKITNRSLVIAITSLALIASSQVFLSLHAMVLTEALFLLLSLAGIHYISTFFSQNENIKYLVLSAVFIGLAQLTRYLGVTLEITALFSIMIFSKKSLSKKISISLIHVIISMTPILLWFGKPFFEKGDVGNRITAFHPITHEKLFSGFSHFLGWFSLPHTFWYLSLPLIFLSFSVFYKLFIPNERYDISDACRLHIISNIFVLVYVPVLLLSISFYDAHTPLSNRILFPLYVFFFLGIVCTVHTLISNKRLLFVRYIGYVLLILLITLTIKQKTIQNSYVLYTKEKGIGLASKKWKQSPIINWLKELNGTVIIYSNDPKSIELYSGKKAKMIPRHTNTITKKRNEKFVNQMNRLVQKIIGGKGVIIYFSSVTWRWYLPTVAQLNKGIPLRPLFEGEDGVVLMINDGNKLVANETVVE